MRRDFELLPLMLDITHHRNVLLWVLLTPMHVLLQETEKKDCDQKDRLKQEMLLELLKKDEEANKLLDNDISKLELVRRLKLQLQEEIRLTPEQLKILAEFRLKWFDVIKESFQSNREVIHLLSALEKQRKSMMMFHTLVHTARNEFMRLLTPLQQARVHTWLHR